MRKVSAALTTAFGQTITSVGYLVQIGFALVQRWSNIGRVLWPSTAVVATYAVVANVCTVTSTAHGIPVGASVFCDFTSGGASALDADFVLTASAANTFTFALVTANTSGNVSFNPVWNDKDFSIDGLAFDVDAPLAATMAIQNLDGLAHPLFMGSDKLYNTPITIYMFDRTALGSGDALGPDVPKIAQLSINGAAIALDAVTLNIVEANADANFSPRRRTASVDGFNFAVPAGTPLAWDGNILTLLDANS